MSENHKIEKKAMTPKERLQIIRAKKERSKIIKAAIVAAISSAGIGSLIRGIKAKKERARSMRPEGSMNTIIVPIKKVKFLEGLPTPRELAESRGEQTGLPAKAKLTQISDQTGIGEVGNTESHQLTENLTPEQINAKKKEILRNGRKFDFFGKRASEKTKSDESSEKKDEEKGEKKDESRTLFRDQDGKFVSPTDPVAIAQTEKDAFIGENVKAFFDKPILWTAGGLGSIYLAMKISDAINGLRVRKAKERLENARDEYVEILNSSEKKAAFDLNEDIGKTLGTAFFIPAALTAIITNKIIKNRKIEKKKQKEISDSYPDEPVILYKMSEANEIRISPETALAMITVKRAMFEGIERDLSMVKSGTSPFDWGFATPRTAMNDLFDYLEKPGNRLKLLNLIKAYGPNGTSQQRTNAINSIKNGVSTLGNFLNGNANEWTKPEFMSQFVQHPRFLNMLSTRFSNDPEFIDYRNSIIDNEIKKTFKEDGILYPLISSIMKNTGIGAYFFNNSLEKQLSNFGKKQVVTR